jgi:hypothetical protein
MAACCIVVLGGMFSTIILFIYLLSLSFAIDNHIEIGCMQSNEWHHMTVQLQPWRHLSAAAVWNKLPQPPIHLQAPTADEFNSLVLIVSIVGLPLISVILDLYVKFLRHNRYPTIVGSLCSPRV